MTITPAGPCYNIVCFPKGNSMFEDSYVVGAIPSRWKLYPAYMHTFGVTENYFIIVEQPLSLSVPEMVKGFIVNNPMAANFKWFTKNTFIYLVNRTTGKLSHTFQADPFFYLHIINSYETDGFVVLDICCYKDASMLDCMYIESIKNMQYNPDYANMFRGRPLRFVCPINKSFANSTPKLIKSLSISNIMNRLTMRPSLKRCETMDAEFYRETKNECNDNYHEGNNRKNLIQLAGSTAEAYLLEDSSVFCKPEMLCDLGCETPRISYELHCGKFMENNCYIALITNYTFCLGKDYQYFYAISSDVDRNNPGTVYILLN